MKEARTSNVYVKSGQTCYLSFSGAHSDGLLTPVAGHEMPPMLLHNEMNKKHAR